VSDFRRYQVRSIYHVKATGHVRGQPEVSYNIEADGCYEPLEACARLKAYGYICANFRKIGTEKYLID